MDTALVYPERVFLRSSGGLIDPSGKLLSVDIDQPLRTQTIGFFHFVESLNGLAELPSP